jgi:myo-inositol-1(or 4)-monophosphatase
VVEGVAAAGGISNPATDELFLGSLNCGVSYNNKPAQAKRATSLDGALVLASRQEYGRGEWERFEGKQFTIRPTGSIAYKLALVSAGLADATWTLSPRHEWDVAGGVALVNSGGGYAATAQSTKLRFNRRTTLLPGLVASGGGLWPQVVQLINETEQLHEEYG